MVVYKEIEAANALINDETAPSVSLFVGGTSGIGNITIKALVSTGVSTRIYLVGRKSSEERMQAFIQEMHTINPKAEIIWTEGEIALLAEVKRICNDIKSKESRIDLLFLTAGYAPMGRRTETTEGLEIAQSLEYYSRMLFIQHLLPLLSKAEAPRVISVLGAGMESATMDLEDLDLKKGYGPLKAQPHYVSLNSTALDKFANENPNITFIHSWPGSVNTGNVRRSADPGSLIAWALWLFVEPAIAVVSSKDDVTGQRHLFLCTSAAFGGRGVPWAGKPGLNTREKPENGFFLVNYKSDCTPRAKVMQAIREKNQEKVWSHMQEVLRPYL